MASDDAERQLKAVESLVCNTCGHTLGDHMWGHHGPGPFDGLVCPTPEARAAYDRYFAQLASDKPR